MPDTAPQQYFMHRISHEPETSQKLLAAGYLPIGYSKAAQEGVTASAKTDSDQAYWTFEQDLAAAYDGHSFRHRSILYRFLAAMSAGDTVLIPGYKVFSLYKITGEVIARPHWPDEIKSLVSGEIDLGYLRPVELIESNIPRAYTSATLTAKMKDRRTGLDLTSLGTDIEQAYAQFKKGAPIPPLVALTESIEAAALQAIHALRTPEDFEQLVCAYFAKLGATTAAVQDKRAKHGNDKKLGDVDVIASFDHLQTTYFVQVKRHGGPSDDVGLKQIRAFAAGQDNQVEEVDGTRHASVLWVVTSGTFSAEVLRQRGRSAQFREVVLIDGTVFARMLVAAGILIA